MVFHVEHSSDHPAPIGSEEETSVSGGDRFASEVARWCCFLAGLALLVSAFVLPVREDLRIMRHQRELALIAQQEHAARNARYAEMIEALEHAEPDTILRLAHANLGLIPTGSQSLVAPGELRDPMLFELLEPKPIARPKYNPERTRLERLVLDRRTRLWVVAGAAVLTLMGLLPMARRG